jgi:hypothetical protein
MIANSLLTPASGLLITLTLCASLCAAAEPKAKGKAATPAATTELFPTDSRQWSQAKTAIVLSDLSQAEPASSLIKGQREKGKWKTIPFATADMKGWALSCYAYTGAPIVSLPLKDKGWHAVYVGASTVSTGFKEARTAFRAKLSDEPVFKRMATNLALSPTRVDSIQEQFVTVAKLDGQSLQFAPLPELPATLCYVKLVPLTAEEVTAWSEQNAKDKDKATRTSIATFDGHSWIWPYEPQTKEDLLANFRGYERSDIGKWWFQVLGADLVIYPSKVGSIPGEHTEDFSTRPHATFVHKLKDLHQRGINPLKVARDEARAQGVEFHIMLRPAGWKASIPYEETFNSKFYEDHPEWRCVDRDGTPTMHMSYAVPEVRKHLLEIYRETLELEPDGVGFLFNRGMPMILWEDAFCERFKKLHNADARTLPDEDPRVLATRAVIMTEFMKEIRALLDETAKKQNRKERYKISLGTFSKEVDNQKFGFDLPLWIKEGLVDDLGVAWFAHHTSFAQPDMAYYSRLTKGTKVGVYPFVISWKSGKPQELCKKVTDFYKGGAAGIAVWDPTVEAGWSERPHGNLFEVMGNLGHREVISRWAAKGVPLPLATPLTRLDENYYSRWFPTTGF